MGFRSGRKPESCSAFPLLGRTTHRIRAFAFAWLCLELAFSSNLFASCWQFRPALDNCGIANRVPPFFQHHTPAGIAAGRYGSPQNRFRSEKPILHHVSTYRRFSVPVGGTPRPIGVVPCLWQNGATLSRSRISTAACVVCKSPAAASLLPFFTNRCFSNTQLLLRSSSVRLPKSCSHRHSSHREHPTVSEAKKRNKEPVRSPLPTRRVPDLLLPPWFCCIPRSLSRSRCCRCCAPNFVPVPAVLHCSSRPVSRHRVPNHLEPSEPS